MRSGRERSLAMCWVYICSLRYHEVIREGKVKLQSRARRFELWFYHPGINDPGTSAALACSKTPDHIQHLHTLVLQKIY